MRNYRGISGLGNVNAESTAHDMKKIILLDFDGVMDTTHYDHYLSYMCMATCDEYGPEFDSECVEALRNIIQQIDAYIVVSFT